MGLHAGTGSDRPVGHAADRLAGGFAFGRRGDLRDRGELRGEQQHHAASLHPHGRFGMGRASRSGAALSMASSQSMAGPGSVKIRSVAAPLISVSATCGRASPSMVSMQARRSASARASASFQASGVSGWPRSSNQAMSGTPGSTSASPCTKCGQRRAGLVLRSAIRRAV